MRDRGLVSVVYGLLDGLVFYGLFGGWGGYLGVHWVDGGLFRVYWVDGWVV